MAFMKKEMLEAEAERLGIDISNLSYSDANKVVQDALKGEPQDEQEKNFSEQPSGPRSWRIPINQKISFGGQRTLIAPEMPPNRLQLLKYDEQLDDEIEVEEAEAALGWDNNGEVERNRTYKVIGQTGRKVVAQSTAPKENAGITFSPDTDLFPVVTAAGRKGYLFSHQYYPCVKRVLVQSGYWEEYKHLFDGIKNPNNIWYAYGKLLVCRIELVHWLLEEINRVEAAKRKNRGY